MRGRTAFVIAACCCVPGVASAGMPVFTFSDVARLRLETVSFFLLVVCAVAYAVRRLWNRLRRDFEGWPELSYRGALAAVVLWGVALHLILGMISGAREVMTPGAWVRDGATYRLAQPATAGDQLRHARQQQLERLRVALFRYAEQHDGRFPNDDYDPAIDENTWQVLDASGLHFVYVAGSEVDSRRAPLAFEPGIYGRERLVLFTDGGIDAMEIDQIYAAIPIAAKI